MKYPIKRILTKLLFLVKPKARRRYDDIYQILDANMAAGRLVYGWKGINA